MPGRRTMVRTTAALAAVAMATGAAACGSSDSGSSSSGSSGGSGGGGKGGKIALLLPESKTARYEKNDKPEFEKKVKELCSSCQIIYANADQDPAKQQSQAEAAITQGAKVLVIDAVDVKSAAAIVNRARQGKVKVISYGRLVAGAPLDYYVSIDPYKVGQQQARVQLDAMKKKGMSKPRVVMVNGSPTDSNAKPYKDGALSVYKQAGAQVVKSFDTPDWSPDKAQQEMEQSVTSLGKSGFDAVYSANDGMASGVVAALKGASIDPASKFITGQDAEVTGIQRILSGEQLMTVYQPIPEIAATAAELAVPLAQGKTPPSDLATQKVDNGAGKVPSKLLPTIAITPKNIEGTVVKDNFLSADEICTAKYKQDCQKYGVK